MMMTTAAASGVALLYDGVPIHARGFALAAVHETSWLPPPGSIFAVDKRVPNAWRHPAFFTACSRGMAPASVRANDHGGKPIGSSRSYPRTMLGDPMRDGR
jgi:hypothetical protein